MTEFSRPNKLGQGYILAKSDVTCDEDECTVLIVKTVIGTDKSLPYAVHIHPHDIEWVDHDTMVESTTLEAMGALMLQMDQRLAVQQGGMNPEVLRLSVEEYNARVKVSIEDPSKTKRWYDYLKGEPLTEQTVREVEQVAHDLRRQLALVTP